MTPAALVLLALAGPPDDGAPRQCAYLVTAVDPTFASTLGYGRTWRRFELTGDLTLPWFVLDGHHYRLDAGARTTAYAWRRLRVLGGLHLQLAGGKNWVHTSTGLGVEASLTAAYVRPRWYAGVDGSFLAHALTYLVHSETYRETQFAEVVDGWYAGTGGRLAIAVEGGVRVTATWEVGLRVGAAASWTLAPPQGLPYFADLAVTRSF